ncbi:hypothetical protein H2198_002938, partial [Neophaeococcomyces mojaviensis]
MADAKQNGVLHLSEVQGEPWPEHIPVLWESFIECASRNPQAPALSSVYQLGEHYGLPNLPIDDDEYRSQPYLRWSYQEFTTAVARAAEGLRQRGLNEDSVIFTFVPNCAEFTVVLWASMCLGCTLIPIHPRTLRNKEEAKHIVTISTLKGLGSKYTVVAGDEEIAKNFLDLNLISNFDLVVLFTKDSNAQWQSFSDLMTSGLPVDHTSLTKDNAAASRWYMIVFTSGTTALPKGCQLNATDWALWCLNRMRSMPVTAEDCCLLTVPNNHAFYAVYELPFRTVGGHTIIPAPSFSPVATMKVILENNCTHLAMSPTMIHAIVQAMAQTHTKLPSLKNITSGGAKISAEFLASCLNDLGSAGVENIYGSTEGGVCASTGVTSKVEDILRDGDIAVGKVAIGASVKVCAIGSRDPLPCGVEGELHFSSRMMCKGYLETGLTDDFYEDAQGRLWFTTGDAAMINEEGLIFIVGRIKDMIIRGGVNISPAAIEFVLQKEPATKAFNIQIISALDKIAGEVPIAVSEKPLSLQEVDVVIKTVLDNMGPVFVPEEVLSLEAFGLTDFPKTTTTKHQKGKLRDIVRSYITQRESACPSGSHEHDELMEKVQNVWKRTIGHDVDLDTDVTEFADSITVMRVRDRINREVGSTLSLADMLSTRTVRDQITMLREIQDSVRVAQQPLKPVNSIYHVNGAGKSAGLTHADIIHLKNAPHLFDSTRTFIESQIGKYDLLWDDVDSVFPASDFVQVLSQADILNESWSWKFCFLANAGVSKQQMRQAVEKFLSNNLALASFLFWNRTAFGSDTGLHVIPNASDRLFNAIISDLGSVATKEEFGKLGLKPYEYEHAILPGPFIKCLLLDVQDVDRAGCIMVMHHVPMDATYMHNIFEDLDRALSFSKPLETHMPWKIWADSYYSLRNSHEAQVAVSWHVNRLNNLLECKQGVFPPLPKVPTRIQPTDDNGYHTSFEATGMTNLRRKHPRLAAPTIMKAAWSLMNLNRTGHTHAVFTNLQADRRKFPFIPPALEAL